MRTNYVLVDYENVQPKSLAALVGDQPFKVMLFVGTNQTKVSFEVAESMQALGTNASYIKINGNGPNALDFHVAYYIGRIACEDPAAFFHIISKDTGFDPLIAHLKTQKIFAARSKEVTDIPLLKAANTKTLAEKVEVVATNLRQRGSGRPRTVKTLSSTIGSLFQKQLSDGDIKAILAELGKRGHVIVDGAKVSYAL
jgi:PIN domain